MFLFPYMLCKSWIRKDLEFSYIMGTFKFYSILGCGLLHGASSVASRVFICLDLFPDAQIKTTHKASSLQICH